MSNYDEYQTPLSSRYPSREMKELFSARNRATTWRKLWLWLAEAEKELGLTQITDEAIKDIRAHLVVTDEAFKVMAEEERRCRHDVMSAVYALGQDAPAAAGIIHIGATSCYVTDNAELIFMRSALDLLLPKLAKVIENLARFALKFKDQPTLAFTHYQAAQPITVGRRAAQWVQDLVAALEDIEYARSKLRFRGAQGTTGTQASFVEIFHGDTAKIDKLNELLCQKAGFPSCYEISTQTYSRQVDLRVANALAVLGATTEHIATDIRLLAHDKVMDEPHESTQIGSSAMSFKLNPMRCERICSLSRKLKNEPTNFAATYSSQILERSLDDSAIRRIDIPEMFLLADSILITMDNVTDGLLVFPAMIERQLKIEIPYMAMETIIMQLVSHGVSRQEAHEQTRVLSNETTYHIRMEGGENDLIERIKRTEFFKPIWSEVDSIVDPMRFVGRAPELTARYVGPGGSVEKALAKYQHQIVSATTASLSV